MSAYLSYEKAVQRSKLIKQGSTSYNLVVNLHKGEHFSGLVIVEFTLLHLQSTFLDFHGKILKIVINNHQVVEQKDNYDGYSLVLQQKYLQLGTNRIVVEFQAYYYFDAQGCKSFTDVDNRQYLYVSLQPHEAHKIFPNFDQPDIKAKYSLIGIYPNEWKFLANEHEVRRFECGQNFQHKQQPIVEFIVRHRSDKKISTFSETPLMSSYLLIFAAGDYFEMTSTNTHKDLRMNLYCLQTNAHKLVKHAKLIWEVVNSGIKYLQSFFRYPYPYSKSDTLFVHEFPFMAMQNPGLVIYDETYLDLELAAEENMVDFAVTIFHQLAHHWFGNLVTMVWWDDLWLNESFADLIGYFVLEKVKNEITAYTFSSGMISFCRRKIWGYDEDTYSTTHPVRGFIKNTDEAISSFDGITYSKGASIIKQILFLMGQEKFSQACGQYFHKFAWKNTVYQDFADCLQARFEIKEFSLVEYLKQWLCTCGHNTLEIQRHKDHIQIVQDHYNFSETLRCHKINLSIFDKDGNKKTVPLFLKNTVTNTYQPQCDIEQSYFLLNDDDHCYVKTKLDQQSYQFFKRSVHLIRDALTRQLIWAIFYQRVIDAQLRSDAYFKIVLDQIGLENDISLLEIILENVDYILENHTPLNVGLQLRTQLFEKILEMLGQEKHEWSQRIKLLQSYLILNGRDKKSIQKLYQLATTTNSIRYEPFEIAKTVVLSEYLTEQQKQYLSDQISSSESAKTFEYLLFVSTIKINKISNNELDQVYEQLFNQNSKLSLNAKLSECQGLLSRKSWYHQNWPHFCKHIQQRLSTFTEQDWPKKFIKKFTKKILSEQQIVQFESILPAVTDKFIIRKELIKIIEASRNKLRTLKLYQ